MSTDSLQFYPTPPALVADMWSKFKSKHYRLILDPEGGNGDLLDGMNRNIQKERVHCIEIDPTRHATLKGKGYRVIDYDFLKHQGGFFYSHVVMNPPFKNAAVHVLHALSMIYNGELVALVSASTIKNPRGDAERELVGQIEKHNGTVEFKSGAFLTDETQRTTPVDVAIIHIEVKNSYDNPYLKSMKVDKEPGLQRDERLDIAFPKTRVEDLLHAFDASVSALREFTLAEDAYLYHRSFLTCRRPPHRDHYVSSADARDSIASNFNESYAELRSSAWDKVLGDTDFMQHLSVKGRDRLLDDFDSIRVLAFTKENIQQFLGSLIRNRGNMQLEIMADSFDMVTAHCTNKAFFKGWKSNDKHAWGAYRMKTTRFILPIGNSYCTTPDSSKVDRIEELERVFAMMEGKSKIDEGALTAASTLRPLFRNARQKAEAGDSARDHYNELCQGERLVTEYFDVRFYVGKGTCHLFPTRPDLVDRLNRAVGKFRQWLPDEEANGDPIWRQFEAAEKVTAALVKKGRAKARGSREKEEEYILRDLWRSGTDLEDAITEIHHELGLDIRLEAKAPKSAERQQLALA